MKLKRVGITAGLIICLVGVNIQGTFGLESVDKHTETSKLEVKSTDAADSTAVTGENTGKASDAGTITDTTIAGGASDGSDLNKDESGTGGGGSVKDDAVKDESNKTEDGSQTTDDSNKPEDGDKATDESGKPEDSDKPADESGKPEDGDKPADESGKPEDGDKPADESGKPEDSDKPADESGKPEDGDKPADESGKPEDGDKPTDESGKTEGDNGTTDGSSKPEENDGTIDDKGNQENNNKDDAGQGSQDDGNQVEDGQDSQDNSKDTGSGGQEKPDGQDNESGGQQTEDIVSDTEIPYYDSERVIVDNSADAVYTGNIYNPSDIFIDNRDKIKYNVALPIEGIPLFITQEMIIGALKCQDETGFPASVTIAQIIQESGFGMYGPEGEQGQGLSYLAFQYNNLFGIKGTGPAGSVDMRTGEQTSAGETYMTTAGFRVYNTYTECIEDRTELLKEVYSDLIVDVTDANTFAMRIGGRWATAIQYSQSLIRQMETYDLYRLDRMTLKEFSKMIGTFADPCPGATVTSDFGWREFRNSFHKGIDLGTGAYNIPTYAADAGTVIEAGWSDSAGNWVVIDHGNGLVTKYMHHDKIYVEKGQLVEKGQQIGLSGTTGDSTGNHLHFQVEENGVAVDPAVYLGLTE